MYFASAIRDAHAAKLIHAPDAVAKAAMLFAYHKELTGARNRNQLSILQGAIWGTLELLAATDVEPATA